MPRLYAGADVGGGNGGDDLVTAVDLLDSDPSTNETPLGTGTGTTGLRGLAIQPSTTALFGATTDQLGVISRSDGVFTPRPAPFGSANGSVGVVALDSVQGIAFDPSTGVLFGIHNRPDNTVTDLLFQIDPFAGSVVTGAFGGDDYIEIVADSSNRQDSFDLGVRSNRRDVVRGLAFGWCSGSARRARPGELAH